MSGRPKLTAWLSLIVAGGILAGAAPPNDAPDKPKKPKVVEPDEEPIEIDGDLPELKKLTPEQINRIRYMELRAMRLDNTSRPDPVQVKIPKDTIDEFLLSIEGNPRYRGKKTRRAFLKMTPAQKLHHIAREKGIEFAEKVNITTDPEIFVDFRKTVMPIVQRGCATTACHGPANKKAVGFRLFKDPKKSPGTTYANFVILNDLHVDQDMMINRAQPEKSLLLNYMLPAKEVPVARRHPGDVEYKPLFQSRKARRFKQIQSWIEALNHPAENYGVHLIEPPVMFPEEKPPPKDKPKDPKPDDSKDTPEKSP